MSDNTGKKTQCTAKSKWNDWTSRTSSSKNWLNYTKRLLNRNYYDVAKQNITVFARTVFLNHLNTNHLLQGRRNTVHSAQVCMSCADKNKPYESYLFFCIAYDVNVMKSTCWDFLGDLGVVLPLSILLGIWESQRFLQDIWRGYCLLSL